jgi:hypothetical protein
MRAASMSSGPPSRSRSARALEQRHRARVLAPRHAHARHRVQQRRLARGIAVQRAHLPLGVVQQARHAQRVAAGVRAGVAALEQPREDAEHVLRRHPLALRTVALLRHAARLERGRDAEPCEREREHDRARHERAVAPDELRDAVRHRVRARAHRPPREIALHVLRHLRGRDVAAVGLLAQRHQHDAIEVAAQRPRRARLGHGARYGRRRVQDRVLERHRAAREGERPRSREQLEQQHA